MTHYKYQSSTNIYGISYIFTQSLSNAQKKTFPLNSYGMPKKWESLFDGEKAKWIFLCIAIELAL